MKKLSKTEGAILKFLTKNGPTDRGLIEDHIRPGKRLQRKVLDVHICNLRRKLAENDTKLAVLYVRRTQLYHLVDLRDREELPE